MNTKRKGNKTEALIIAEFVKREIPVLIPFGDAESYDLVIDINNNFYRIQCKTCRPRGEHMIEFNTVSTSHNTNNHEDNNYIGKIEFFATVHNNISYLIPIEDAAKSKMQLKTDYAPNGNGSGTWAYDYELDKILNGL